MERTIVRTAQAPAAIGPYSQAVVVTSGNTKTIYCSGQVGLDPHTMTIVEGGLEAQTRQVLENLGAVLAAAGARFSDVVRTTIFLAECEDFAKDFATVNAIYGERFTSSPPARATVQAAHLPKDALVEIDAIAVVEV